MATRTINSKEILKDIKPGIRFADLMEKYELSERSLKTGDSRAKTCTYSLASRIIHLVNPECRCREPLGSHEPLPRLETKATYNV